MPKQPLPTETETVACDVCLTEIPRDLAKSEEAAGYVHHFCGGACYAKWREGARPVTDKKPV